MKEKIEDKIKSVLEQSYNQWKDKLTEFDGFIDNTQSKRKEIGSDMRDNVLMKNDDIKSLIKDLESITRKKYLN
jgi:antibiotic biosynthesis monooxygenase (ABM) superfamily enzyme